VGFCTRRPDERRRFRLRSFFAIPYVAWPASFFADKRLCQARCSRPIARRPAEIKPLERRLGARDRTAIHQGESSDLGAAAELQRRPIKRTRLQTQSVIAPTRPPAGSAQASMDQRRRAALTTRLGEITRCAPISVMARRYSNAGSNVDLHRRTIARPINLNVRRHRADATCDAPAPQN
jgi:hypothetical protein